LFASTFCWFLDWLTNNGQIGLVRPEPGAHFRLHIGHGKPDGWDIRGYSHETAWFNSFSPLHLYNICTGIKIKPQVERSFLRYRQDSRERTFGCAKGLVVANIRYYAMNGQGLLARQRIQLKHALPTTKQIPKSSLQGHCVFTISLRWNLQYLLPAYNFSFPLTSSFCHPPSHLPIPYPYSLPSSIFFSSPHPQFAFPPSSPLIRPSSS